MSRIFASSSESESYEIPESLSAGADDVLGVDYIEPGEADRDELLLEKLGVLAWGRLHYFRQIFSGPWGEAERGRPLSPRAVVAFFRFLEHADLPVDRRPSLFLTDEGHLEMCWEDSEGLAIQMEFGPRASEVYFEASESEEQIPNSELARFAQSMNANR